MIKTLITHPRRLALATAAMALAAGSVLVAPVDTAFASSTKATVVGAPATTPCQAKGYLGSRTAQGPKWRRVSLIWGGKKC